MCIAFFLWQCHSPYRFYLALNRDEVLSRPTLPVHWWPEQNGILAGKDLSKGGTWFGCCENGRVAFVTTFRDTEELIDPESRGELTVSFLKSTKTPFEYLQEISEARHKYNGFNLIVADILKGEMAYLSNRPLEDPLEVQIIPSGLHVLCNGLLNAPWPKALRGRAKMGHILDNVGASKIPKERVLNEVLMDDVKADVAFVPKTGCSMEWEHKLSSIFVDTIGIQGPYGTRSMIIFTVDVAGNATLFERYKEDGNWKENEFCFSISS